MSDVSPTPRPDAAPRPPDQFSRNLIIAFGAVAVVAVVALLAVVILVATDDDGDVIIGGGTSTSTTEPSVTTTTVPPTTTAPVLPTTTTTTSTSTTTTAAPTTSTAPTTTSSAVDTRTAVFPTSAGTERFGDAIAVATAFAEDYLGMTDPVVGELRAGDSRSGEVPVQPTDDGPETTVLVRQLEDDSWWVLGATTEGIVVDEPPALAVITSPVAVRGQAHAFEGNVVVEVRADDAAEPLGRGNVTGGGDQLRPFDGEITFAEPQAEHGALVFLIPSAEDGATWAAAVLRISFG